MKKQIFSLLTAMCMLLTTVPTFVMAQEQAGSTNITPVYSENFDDDVFVTGQTIIGKKSWKHSTEKGHSYNAATDPASATNKVLDTVLVKFDQTANGNTNKFARQELNYSLTKKYLMVNYRIRLDNASNRADCYLTFDNSNLLQFSVSPSDGNGHFYSSRNQSDSDKATQYFGANVTINKDTWYDVKLVIDKTNLKYDMYLENVKINANPVVLYKDTEITKLTRLDVGTWRKPNSTGHVYFDDIVITEFDEAGFAEYDLEYTTVDFADSGNFTLPSTGVFGSVISWASNNGAISVSGNTATVNKPYSSADVTLTATATYSGATASKTFAHTVDGYVESDVLYSENFDTGYTNGDLNNQNSWSVDNNAAAGNTNKITDDPVADSVGDKAVQVDLNSTWETGNKYATMTLNKNISAYDYVVFSHKLYYADNDRYANFYITFNNTSNGNNLIQMTYNPEAQTNRFTSSSLNDTQSFGEDVEVPVGKWLDMKIVLNRAAKTYDFYLDNAKIGAGLAIYDTSEAPTSIKNIQIGVYRKHGKNGVIYYDDIAINGYKTADKTWSDLYNLNIEKNIDADFTLPTGLGNNTAITWASSDSSMVSISGSNASVTLPYNTTAVTLTATATNNGLTASREFVCNVSGYEDSIKTLYNETFDGYESADIAGQNSWYIDKATYTENDETKETTGNNTTVGSDPAPQYDGDKAVNVELVKEWTGDNRYAAKELNIDVSGTKYIMFSHQMRFENNARKANFYIWFKGSGDNHIQLGYTPGDAENRFASTTAVSGDDETFGGNVEIPYGKWIDIKILLDVANKTYDLYMDNVKVNDTALALYNDNDITKIQNVRLGAIRHHGGSGNLYFDDIKFTSFGDEGAVWYTMNSVDIPSKVHTDFDIKALFGSSLTVTDNSDAISVSGLKADVNSALENQDIKLTVTSTIGEASYSREFDITLLALKNAFAINGLTFDGSNAILSVTKNTEQADANAKAIVAVYDTTTGKLIKASTPVAVNSTGNVTIEGMELPANSKACAFIWKMDTLVPLATMFGN